MRIHFPAPVEGDPSQQFVVTRKGAWRPRCQSIFNGHQCLKKMTHVQRDDTTHSDGVFVWNEDRGEQIDWENALVATEEPSAKALATKELGRWWLDTAKAEIDQTVAKAVEYGSTDLIDIGRSLARVAGRELDDQQAAEWGIFFYLEGKLSRWRSAMERGDVVSLDTLLDIGVYARMAQRVRMTGGWPGTKEDTE